jgi:hypothetical protein
MAMVGNVFILERIPIGKIQIYNSLKVLVKYVLGRESSLQVAAFSRWAEWRIATCKAYNLGETLKSFNKFCLEIDPFQ